MALTEAAEESASAASPTELLDWSTGRRTSDAGSNAARFVRRSGAGVGETEVLEPLGGWDGLNDLCPLVDATPHWFCISRLHALLTQPW